MRVTTCVKSLGYVALLTLLGMGSQAFFVSSALAQTLDDISAPAEVPPANYLANQYVDSRGCVFVRAGFGGVVNWVPRVTRDQKVLCGYKPSGAGGGAPASANANVTVIGGADEMSLATGGGAPARAAPATVSKKPTVARKIRVALPTTDGGPPELRQLTVRTTRGGVVSCPADKPRLQRYALSDGRQLLRCAPPADAPGDYRILNAPPPEAAPAIPPGYRAAWKDGRLNPMRGPRSTAGDAAMSRVWDDAVPAERTAPKTRPGAYVVHPLPVSGGKAATVKATGKGRYVQVGTFADPSNASKTQARIAALGLPAFANETVMGGRRVQVILAGPFDDPSNAASALAKVRRGGFGDAFLRG